MAVPRTATWDQILIDTYIIKSQQTVGSGTSLTDMTGPEDLADNFSQ